MQRSMISSSVIGRRSMPASFAVRLDQRLHFGIGSGLAILIVEIPAAAGLLPVAAHFEKLSQHQRPRECRV